MKDQKQIKIEKIIEWLGTGSINIFGLPFSGKDTHGKELASMTKGILIGGGDILRSGETPTHVIDAINKGSLAPTDEYKKIVLPYLSRNEYKEIPLVLSSVGRWSGEEISVIESAKDANHPIKAVILLDIDQKEVWKRWNLNKRERHDDKAEHILENRFQEFETKTLPVIEYYEKIGLLIKVDGKPAQIVVTNKIIDELYELAK